MNSSVDLIKADALRRLRSFRKQARSRFQRKAKAKRDLGIRAYLAEIVQGQLMGLIDGQVLAPIDELEVWFDGVLNDAVENASRHADAAAAADQHRDSLLDIVRSGKLAEVERRQRSWAAPA